MKRTKILILCLLLGLAAVTTRSAQSETVWLSVPFAKIGETERIVDFELKITGATIRSIPQVPEGWFLSLTNDASGSSEIRGNIQVGAAALYRSFFSSFLFVDKKNDPQIKFSIAMDVSVTKDFEKFKYININTSEMIVSVTARSSQPRPHPERKALR
jgi:hypothetical protein